MCNFVIVTRATSAPWAERVAGSLCAHACATPGVGLHACLHFRLPLTSVILVVACIACTITLKQNRTARNEAKPTPTMLCATICRGSGGRALQPSHGVSCRLERTSAGAVFVGHWHRTKAPGGALNSTNITESIGRYCFDLLNQR